MFCLLLQVFTGKDFYIAMMVYVRLFQLHSKNKVIWLFATVFVLYFYTIKRLNTLYKIPFCWDCNLFRSLFLCHTNRKTVRSSCNGNHIACFLALTSSRTTIATLTSTVKVDKFVLIFYHTSPMSKWVWHVFYFNNFFTRVSSAMWCNPWCILIRPFAQHLLQFWIVCITGLKQSQFFFLCLVFLLHFEL